MDTQNQKRRGSRWGLWLVVALIVAALCVGALWYIGWLDNRTHVDSPDGDNVTADYVDEQPGSEAPGVNDWENPGHNSLREVITEHAQEAE